MERYISFESYNTKPFLLDKLDYYKTKGTILDYCCVYHNKDERPDKETGELKPAKFHWHLIIDKGNKRLGAEFKENFNEIDPNNTIPLKMKWDRNTKLSFHWYGYTTHNPKYLELHPPQKKTDEIRHEYFKEEFICSNQSWLDDMEEELMEYLENPPLSESQLYFQVVNYINDYQGYFSQKRLNDYIQEKDLLDVFHKYKYEIQTLIRENNKDYQTNDSIDQRAYQKAVQMHKKVEKENSIIANLTTNFDKVTIEEENETFDVMRVDYKKHKGGN